MKRLVPLCLTFLLVGCGGEPEIQGQPLSAWIGALEDPNIQPQASQVLVDAASQDKNVVRQLVAAVNRGSFNAVETLAKIGPTPMGDDIKNVVKALSGAVKSKNLSLRLAAARALPKLGPPAKEATPALIEMLKDSDPVVRRQAAETLGKIPGVGKEATGPLLQATRDPLLDVKGAALEALEKVDPDAFLKAKGGK
jgi:HEAT repeat protein